MQNGQFFLHLLEKYTELAEDESHRDQLLEKTVAVLCEYSWGPTQLMWNLFHFKPLLRFLDEYALEFIFSRLEGEEDGDFGKLLGLGVHMWQGMHARTSTTFTTSSQTGEV